MTGADESGPVDAFGRKLAAEEPTVPRHVQLARWIWVGATLLGLVRSLVQLGDRRMLISRIREMAPKLSQSEVDAAANSGILLTLLVSVGLVAVYVLLSTRMVQGRNWARIAIGIIAGVGVLGTLLALIGMTTLGSSVALGGATVQLGALDIVFSVVIACLDAAVLVLIVQPDSNRFFREAGSRLRARRAGRLRDPQRQ